MTSAESQSLKTGSRVYWRGDATDGGSNTEISWDAVTIAWDNGQLAAVHHGDMREIQRTPAMPPITVSVANNVCVAGKKKAEVGDSFSARIT